MKPVRLPASATNALPRWGLFALCLLYILPGLIGRDPWKNEDAIGFGIMWTMAHGGLSDWLSPNIVGLPMPEQGPLAFWLGAICIKLFGWLLGDAMAARIATVFFFLLGSLSVWHTTYLLGRRAEAQPLKLAFGGQPEPKDYGRTLADGALLIYLGCLGLLLHSHTTSAGALQVSLVAATLYIAVRFFELYSIQTAAMLGLVLGLLILTRGWVVPLALWLGCIALVTQHTPQRDKKIVTQALLRLVFVTLPIALAVFGIWFGNATFDAWMEWNYRQLDLPSGNEVKYFFKNSIWFAWPAWPFAGWAIYAWRRQHNPLHIVLPLMFFIALVLLAIFNPHSEEGLLLPLLPPLAILAAFGLPTMKRGAINAVDWFSVMTLTVVAGFIWLGWIAKQTGWPAWLARNAMKLAPGFKPEFNLAVVAIAAFASAGWIVLVRWRISRQPSVLWRAVVLSSGGVILCWLLLMTLWMPWGNYMKSYARVAQQIAQKLPLQQCVDTNVGPAQRASFAYFGNIRFASANVNVSEMHCSFLLLQDNNREKDRGKDREKDSAGIIQRNGSLWQLLWEGRRPSDRDERFRLYQRIN